MAIYVVRQPNWLFARYNTSSKNFDRIDLPEEEAHQEAYSRSERNGDLGPGIIVTIPNDALLCLSAWDAALREIELRGHDGVSRAEGYRRSGRRASRYYHPPFAHSADPATAAAHRAIVLAWERVRGKVYADETARSVCEALETVMWKYDVA